MIRSAARRTRPTAFRGGPTSPRRGEVGAAGQFGQLMGSAGHPHLSRRGEVAEVREADKAGEGGQLPINPIPYQGYSRNDVGVSLRDRPVGRGGGLARLQRGAGKRLRVGVVAGPGQPLVELLLPAPAIG